jgi:hypothetical protein
VSDELEERAGSGDARRIVLGLVHDGAKRLDGVDKRIRRPPNRSIHQFGSRLSQARAEVLILCQSPSNRSLADPCGGRCLGARATCSECRKQHRISVMAASSGHDLPADAEAAAG